MHLVDFGVLQVLLVVIPIADGFFGIRAIGIQPGIINLAIWQVGTFGEFLEDGFAEERVDSMAHDRITFIAFFHGIEEFLEGDVRDELIIIKVWTCFFEPVTDGIVHRKRSFWGMLRGFFCMRFFWCFHCVRVDAEVISCVFWSILRDSFWFRCLGFSRLSLLRCSRFLGFLGTHGFNGEDGMDGNLLGICYALEILGCIISLMADGLPDGMDGLFIREGSPRLFLIAERETFDLRDRFINGLLFGPVRLDGEGERCIIIKTDGLCFFLFYGLLELLF